MRIAGQKFRYTNHWQEDRAVAAGRSMSRPGEESPNSAGQCAG